MNRTHLILLLVAGGLGYFAGRATRGASIREYVIQTDTVVREVARLDTVFASRLRVLDSTRTLWDTLRVRDTLVRNDTVFVPRATADATLLACTDALSTCSEQRLLLQALFDVADSTVKEWGGPPAVVDWKLASALSALAALVLALLFR